MLKVNTDATAWEEFKNPEGRAYFYNSKTTESTWDKPIVLNDVIGKRGVEMIFKRLISLQMYKINWNRSTKPCMNPRKKWNDWRLSRVNWPHRLVLQLINKHPNHNHSWLRCLALPMDSPWRNSTTMTYDVLWVFALSCPLEGHRHWNILWTKDIFSLGWSLTDVRSTRWWRESERQSQTD